MGSLELKAKFLAALFKKKSNTICNKLILKKMRMTFWLWKRILDVNLPKGRQQRNINRIQKIRICKMLFKRKMKNKLMSQTEGTQRILKRKADRA